MHRRAISRAAAGLLLFSSAPALHAQPVPPAPLPAANPDDPVERLSRYLRLLADNPRSLEALTGAGKAALEVGDASAAVGFYARAQEAAPGDGRVKAGLAAALVQLEQPKDALRLFDKAKDLGVPEAEFAADRGLAYDLRGEGRRAQADYRLALARGGAGDETVRRLALSLAMAGDRTGALAALDPLMRRQDRAAWRASTFVLAITGDVAGADERVRLLMTPPQAQAMQPFLARLAALDPAAQAAAVHFGHFPAAGQGRGTQLAAAAAPRATPAVPAEPAASPGFTDAFARRATGDARAKRRRPGEADAPVEVAAAVPTARAPAPAVSSRPVPSRAEITMRAPLQPASPVTPPSPAPAGPPIVVAAASPPPAPAGRAPAEASGAMPSARAPASLAAPVRPGDAAPRADAATVRPIEPASIPARAPDALARPGATQPPSIEAGTERSMASSVASATMPTMPVAAPAPVAALSGEPAGAASPVSERPVEATAAASAAPLARTSGPPAALAPVSRSEPAAAAAPASVEASPAAAEEAPPASPPDAALARPARLAEADQPPAPRTSRAPETPPQPAPSERTRTGSGHAASKDGEETTARARPKPAPAAADTPAVATAKAGADARKKAADDAKAKKAADDARKAKAAEEARAKAKAAQEADAKAKAAEAKRQARKEPERYWVQVAGGANKHDLPKAWDKLRAAHAQDLAGKSPHTTPLRFTNRLLIGPFKSADEAQAYVNRTAKSGWTTFTFTSPAGQKVEAVPAE